MTNGLFYFKKSLDVDHPSHCTCHFQLAWIATTTWPPVLMIRTSRASFTNAAGPTLPILANLPRGPYARLGYDIMAIRFTNSNISAVFNVWAGLHRRFTGSHSPPISFPIHINHSHLIHAPNLFPLRTNVLQYCD